MWEWWWTYLQDKSNTFRILDIAMETLPQHSWASQHLGLFRQLHEKAWERHNFYPLLNSFYGRQDCILTNTQMPWKKNMGNDLERREKEEKSEQFPMYIIYWHMNLWLKKNTFLKINKGETDGQIETRPRYLERCFIKEDIIWIINPHKDALSY